MLFSAEINKILAKISINKNNINNLVMPYTYQEMLIKSKYTLVQRGGFIAGTTINEFWHLRKKSIYMFTEASLFSSDLLSGKIENVRPDWNDKLLHPVYKDGRVLLYL